ncbi:MAG: hypothetical protein AVDCRST_MAG73-2694 [uncultured Thermomicrobiales bacterium]|uniref:DUF4260 domain-containing protein n=1 Tax=uncultured Thermomicrobiales bacterium TaxID=1645740 RepID=A0A6J4UIT7_9BACT|nr:MAG: hypothetical protein AVDCRST_MAG73-2694 [uncultured Thermomicrobiales bacterium]
MSRLLLRLEGAALLVASVILYRQFGAGWPRFALLILAPDLAALAYLAGGRLGAVAYNLAHTSAIPLTLAVVAAWESGWDGDGTTFSLALIWLAHIGMDRLAGYGVKDPGGVTATRPNLG